mmetsp:Transcript_3274/g.4514  ORF Transcript_3274/g.4514 Transcript_3274/m.4514 type:complete len:90 (+) Transcript_3274:3224-3493(+)
MIILTLLGTSDRTVAMVLSDSIVLLEKFLNFTTGEREHQRLATLSSKIPLVTGNNLLSMARVHVEPWYKNGLQQTAKVVITVTDSTTIL